MNYAEQTLHEGYEFTESWPSHPAKVSSIQSPSCPKTRTGLFSLKSICYVVNDNDQFEKRRLHQVGAPCGAAICPV